MKKDFMLKELENAPEMVLATAYLYAKNYCAYGEDITKAFVTATQQHAFIERVYMRAYEDAMKSITGKDNNEDRNTHMTDDDIAFLTKLLMQISVWARDQGYEPDDTIKTIGGWFVNLPTIATFNQLGEDK